MVWRVLRQLREGAWEFGFVSSKNMCGFWGKSGFLTAPDWFWVGLVAPLVGLFCAAVLRGLQGAGDRCKVLDRAM
jgi:hypothetical protein